MKSSRRARKKGRYQKKKKKTDPKYREEVETCEQKRGTPLVRSMQRWLSRKEEIAQSRRGVLGNRQYEPLIIASAVRGRIRQEKKMGETGG